MLDEWEICSYTMFNKTRLLRLGSSISTSEKTQTLLPWKTTSRFRQTVKYGQSHHVGQDIPNEHVLICNNSLPPNPIGHEQSLASIPKASTPR